MNTLNSLIIEGKIKDFLDNGVVIETVRHYKNADGDDAEETSEFDVICYGNLLVALLKYGKKEGGIRVVGRLKLTRWNEGDKMCSKVVIIAEHIEFKKIK